MMANEEPHSKDGILAVLEIKQKAIKQTKRHVLSYLPAAGGNKIEESIFIRAASSPGLMYQIFSWDRSGAALQLSMTDDKLMSVKLVIGVNVQINVIESNTMDHKQNVCTMIECLLE